MELTIQASALSSALGKLSSVVERKSTLPILSHVLLQADGENITITGTDGEKECTVTTPAQVKTAGAICLEMKKLADIASSAVFKGKDLTVKLGDGKATVSAGKSKFTVNTLPAEQFPSMEQLKQTGTELTLPASALRGLLDTVSHAMAVQDVRYYLNGALIELSSGKITAVSTDGHRCAVAETPVPIEMDGAIELILPRTAVIALLSLLKDGDQALQITAVEHHRFEVSMNGLVFRSKLIDGKFPNWRYAIPKNEHAATIDRDLLLQHVAAAEILAHRGKEGAGVVLEFAPANGGQVRVTSRSEGEETDLEPIACEYSGPPIEIAFNSRYLTEALPEIASDRVQIELQQTGASIVMRSPDTEAPLFVVSPRRI